MNIQPQCTNHLVKSEDLNHHGTLYAGRTAEWFVEAGFIAAAKLTNPENIVCLKIHGMQFSEPVRRGEILHMESKIVLTGKTSLVAYIQALRHDKLLLYGFITFVHVNKSGQPTPHGITIKATSAEDKTLQEQARNLSR
ncbi:MAG TPA: acyl-CoA thioesterase [Anaerolineae bacterium]|nr:acyl-CoA thioesterase [Anaerolineae bacterium]